MAKLRRKTPAATKSRRSRLAKTQRKKAKAVRRRPQAPALFVEDMQEDETSNPVQSYVNLGLNRWFPGGSSAFSSNAETHSDFSAFLREPVVKSSWSLAPLWERPDEQSFCGVAPAVPLQIQPYHLAVTPLNSCSALYCAANSCVQGSQSATAPVVLPSEVRDFLRNPPLSPGDTGKLLYQSIPTAQGPAIQLQVEISKAPVERPRICDNIVRLLNVAVESYSSGVSSTLGTAVTWLQKLIK